MIGDSEQPPEPEVAGHRIPGGAIPPDGTAAVTGMADPLPEPPDLDTEGPKPGEEPNTAPGPNHDQEDDR